MKRIILIFCLLFISSYCFCQVWQRANGMTGSIVSFAVKDTLVFALAHKEGVFSSSDFGKTWIPLGLAYDLSLAYSMRAIPKIEINDNNIYVGIYPYGLYYSSNDGANWIKINTPSNNITRYIVNQNNIFISTNINKYISNDNGISWKETNLDCEECIYSLAIKDSNFYVASDLGDIYLSTDNGKSWNNIRGNLPNNSITSISVSGDTIYIGTEDYGIFQSINSGKNWNPINNGLTYFSIDNILLSGNNIFVLADNNAIFLSTNNGQIWNRINKCIFRNYIYAFTVIDDNIIIAMNGGLFISTNYGRDWEYIKKSVTDYVGDIKTDKNNVYASSDDGLFLSTNQGISWLHLTKDFIDKEDYRIFNFTSYVNRVYLGTHYYGIASSIDNGKSWNEINNGIPLSWCYSIVAKDNIIFSCFGNDGFYKSIDYGQSWYSIKKEYPSSVYSLAIKDSTVIAGTNKGIIISNDYGDNWIKSNIDSTFNIVYDLIVKDDNIFAGTDSNGVLLSTDNGLNWSQSNIGIGELNVTSFAVSGDNIYAGTWGGGVFLSTNNGKMWFQKLKGLKSYRIRSLASIGNIIFALTDTSGIFLSTNNGQNWVQKQIPEKWYLNYQMNALFTFDNILFVGSEDAIWCTKDSCKTWLKIDSGLYVPNFKRIGSRIAIEDSNIFFIDDYDNIFQSTNYGNHWNPVNNLLKYTYIRFIQLHNNTLYAGTEKGFFISNDFGQNWSQDNNELTDSIIVGCSIDDNKILISVNGKLYLSTDNAQSWFQLNDVHPDIGITLFELSGDYIFVGTQYNGIFISSDLGQSWSDENFGVSYSRTINAIGTKDSNVFIGSTTVGVHYSSNYGQSWREVNSGIWDFFYNDACIFDLAISDDNNVYTSPHSHGVYRLNIDEITNVNDNPIDENVLLSLSPNPSTTTCTISFSESGLCRKFKLFNCFGEDMTGTLMNTKINDNNIQFDVSALSAGVYFAVLDLNGRLYSKPFVVVR